MDANKSEIFNAIAISSSHIGLARGEIWSRKVVSGNQIACDRGIIWLTHTNDSKDYLLNSQEYFVATKSGKVVVQALTAATINLR